MATKQRKDRGHSRAVTNETRQAIEGFHLNRNNQHLSFASIFRHVKKQLTEKGLPYPQYRTTCRILSGIPKSMKTLAHKGSKAYKQQFDLLYMRESKYPNEIWQTDHCELDLMLLNQKGAPQRPWLSIVFDDHSRCVAGYELSFLYPSILKTALALRQSIWNKKDPNWTVCGIPSTLYTDHGSDFTSHHVEQVCAALKINLIFSQVAEPRGRGKIERFFLTLNQLLLCELPGYLAAKSKPSLCLAELDALLRPFIIQYNPNRTLSNRRRTQNTLGTKWIFAANAQQH